MGLTELENKLAAIVPDTDFKLDERSTLDILNWLKEYAEKIPFDQDKNKFWDSFYFIQENNPEKLADIYQNANKAKGFLPAHQAFILAFLKLLETTKVLFNTFPARHRDLYYRELLGLKPREAQADSVALGITLNTDNAEYLIPKGTLFDAGQDIAGNPLQYASDTDLLANQGKLTDLRWYRKDNDGWQSATPLNLSDNIKLPEKGIKLFSPTLNDTPVLSGYLITSSLFAMSKGERSIKVTLEKEWTGNPHHITAKISSGNDWLSLLVEKENNKHLKLCLSAKDAPISPPDNLDNMTFDLPVLKLSTTQGIILPKITGIKISINGNHNVLYASDDGIERTDATSFPFGQSPTLASGFNLVAPEWYGTKESTLTLTPQWIGLPTENFETWYNKYSPKPANNGVFKVQGYLVTSQKTRDVLNGNEAQALFRENTKPQGKSLTFTLPAMDYSFADNPSPNDWPASIRIELSGQDFMHSQYKQSSEGKKLPYTPQISELKIEFKAEVKAKQYSVYPLTPFGWSNTNTETPSLSNDTFYLGFTDVSPRQTLSLYWQLEGLKELTLSWSYLNKNNTWQPLTQPIHDRTRNLFDKGGWSALLPQDASNQASQMPTGRYWIKAQMNEVKHYPQINGLLYNATTATLINTEIVEQDHLINKLAANSIKQPVNAFAAINDVNQPWSSWNGSPKETEQAFLTRVPARLSHRNRALSWSDIVTLLKENFVSLFDIKYPSASELTKIPAPEKRQLIVIPDNRYRDNHDALRPELNPAQLTEMVEWIDRLSSLWTTIEIKNPTYIDVKVNYQVVFISGVNPDYGHHQLQQELSRKYMPWGENIAIGVTPGNRIDYYQLLATIQQSSLVERVTKLILKKASQSESAIGESIDADDDEVLILVWNKNP
ncbi:hypothetical protein [Photorhabdus khanii]|uniref:Baseplate protein J-like domain-containing protein n=1 Tax=Photorhabdus khanii subsp. guanajuatensis TaxID=2100166 RepID=A0A4V2X7T9_9GAMM|nr:hypothetical protein [Photorhabdus khanii]TDB57285.1 hypothetical protein C5467_11620 [Photorhabdus khanii subsp. guanajuatensis]